MNKTNKKPSSFENGFSFGDPWGFTKSLKVVPKFISALTVVSEIFVIRTGKHNGLKNSPPDCFLLLLRIATALSIPPSNTGHSKKKSTSFEVLFFLVTRGGIEPPLPP